MGEPTPQGVSAVSYTHLGLGQPNVRIVENMQEADCIGLEVPNSSQSVQTIYLKAVSYTHLTGPEEACKVIMKGVEAYNNAK